MVRSQARHLQRPDLAHVDGLFRPALRRLLLRPVCKHMYISVAWPVADLQSCQPSSTTSKSQPTQTKYSSGLSSPTPSRLPPLVCLPLHTSCTRYTFHAEKRALVLVAFVSDRIKLRGAPMLAMLPISIAGYAAIAHVQSASARFGMTCLMAMGMYSSVPCVLVWNANNSAGHFKRATTSALQLAVANCGGFVASTLPPLLCCIYQESDLSLLQHSYTPTRTGLCISRDTLSSWASCVMPGLRKRIPSSRVCPLFSSSQD